MRLGAILYRARRDDAARFQNVEVELLEKRELRVEGPQQKDYRQQWDEEQGRRPQEAAEIRHQHRRDDAGLVDL